MKKINFTDNDSLHTLCGEHDKHLKIIEDLATVKINIRGNILSVTGDNLFVEHATNLIKQLYGIASKGHPLFPLDIEQAHKILSENSHADLEKIFLDTVFIASKKRVITPKSISQKNYIDAIRNSEMVF